MQINPEEALHMFWSTKFPPCYEHLSSRSADTAPYLEVIRCLELHLQAERPNELHGQVVELVRQDRQPGSKALAARPPVLRAQSCRPARARSLALLQGAGHRAGDGR